MIFTTIRYFWTGKKCTTSLILHNRTVEQAREIATQAGWRPFKWYKPSTWRNLEMLGPAIWK